jgi:hypothetical protein
VSEVHAVSMSRVECLSLVSCHNTTWHYSTEDEDLDVYIFITVKTSNLSNSVTVCPHSAIPSSAFKNSRD